MSQTYSQLYVHLVFAVAGRQSFIPEERREELHRRVTTMIRGRGQTVLAINSMPDHMHILVAIRPDIAISDLVRDIKALSSRQINLERWIDGHFSWQEGFGAFSHSQAQLPSVIRHIGDQAEQHAHKSFRLEYEEMLGKYRLDGEPQALFDWGEERPEEG